MDETITKERHEDSTVEKLIVESPEDVLCQIFAFSGNKGRSYYESYLKYSYSSVV